MNDSGPAGQRVPGRSTTPVTFRFSRTGDLVGFVACIIILAIIGAALAISPAAAQSGLNAWGEIAVFWLPLAGFVWLGICWVRAGVQIRGEQVAIRGFVRTRKLNVSQIREITLESKVMHSADGDRNYWTPCLRLTDGSSIRLKTGQTGPLGKPAPERLQGIVRDMRWHLGIDRPAPSRDQ